MEFKEFNTNRGEIFISIEGFLTGKNMTPEHILDLESESGNAFIKDIIENWNGSYAVVIRHEDCIVAFTDPHGVEQLYYTLPDENGDVEFARFINELPKKEVDNQYFSEVLKWGYNTDDRTPWNNIKRVMPGEIVMYDYDSQLFYRCNPFQKYFDEKEEDKTKSLKELVHEAVLTRVNALPESVKTIGMLLSGGLDSSCIACELLSLQKENLLGGRNIKFYTINNADDAPYVQKFVDMFGIEVTTLSYDMKDVDIIKAMEINETPVDLGSMVPNQKMFEAIPEEVLFTGDGPDEMFGGYNRIDQYDSQLSDTFEELSFYHYPRLNKAANYYHKTLVCPYTDRKIVARAIATPFAERTHKKVLKDAYRGLIPDEIINRPKLPLKNDELRKDPVAYRFKITKEFLANLTNKA